MTIAKIPSTPDDPSRAILQGIAEPAGASGVAAGDIGFFCHGTTVGTNALLEGKGVRTGLLVTEGFRGIYEVGEQARPLRAGDLRRDLRQAGDAGAGEPDRRGRRAGRLQGRRCSSRSTRPRCATTVRTLAARGIESLAVCLLFSFLHPEHEARVREIVAEEAAGLEHFAVVGDVPQIREYYRLSTTVINAYLQPILGALHRPARRAAERGRASPRGRNTSCSRTAAWRPSTPPRARAVATVLSGPGRRRHRRRLCLPDDRAAKPHHLRHGRHLLRRRADQGRRAAASPTAARSKAATSPCR